MINIPVKDLPGYVQQKISPLILKAEEILGKRAGREVKDIFVPGHQCKGCTNYENRMAVLLKTLKAPMTSVGFELNQNIIPFKTLPPLYPIVKKTLPLAEKPNRKNGANSYQGGNKSKKPPTTNKSSSSIEAMKQKSMPLYRACAIARDLPGDTVSLGRGGGSCFELIWR